MSNIEDEIKKTPVMPMTPRAPRLPPDAHGRQRAVKVIPMPGGGQLGRKRLAVEKQKATKEFKAWKAELKKLIDNGSRLEMKQDGSYQFLFPQRLVHLIWGTTIKERVAWEVNAAAQKGEALSLEELRKRAMARLTADIEEAQAAFLADEDVEEVIGRADARAKQVEEVAVVSEEEERQASEELARIRAELIKEKEGE